MVGSCATKEKTNTMFEVVENMVVDLKKKMKSTYMPKLAFDKQYQKVLEKIEVGYVSVADMRAYRVKIAG